MISRESCSGRWLGIGSMGDRGCSRIAKARGPARDDGLFKTVSSPPLLDRLGSGHYLRDGHIHACHSRTTDGHDVRSDFFGRRRNRSFFACGSDCISGLPSDAYHLGGLSERAASSISCRTRHS